MFKKLLVTGIATIMLLPVSSAFADYQYTVKSGDTLWKIAVKNKIGVSEMVKANPTLKNPNMIYVGQKLTVPTDEATSNYVQQVITLTNKERAKVGLPALKENWELSRVAQFKSEDMRKNHYFDHNSPTYGSPFQMMKSFGITYKSAGENIAQGQRTPEAVVQAWMNSSGHRANILSKSFTQIGVGYDANGHYWTQQFISK